MILIIIISTVVLLLLFYVIGTYNSLITLRNRVKDGWAQIDVLLKRRADLIPNLIETVKGYTSHEKGTLESVINARNSFASANTPAAEMQASGEMTNALNKLFALAEAYPDLKANENFMSLQNDLSDTENKISFSRQFYNDTVVKYKDKIEMFPSNIIAGLFGFKEEKFFEITESDKEVPKVQF